MEYNFREQITAREAPKGTTGDHFEPNYLYLMRSGHNDHAVLKLERYDSEHESISQPSSRNVFFCIFLRKQRFSFGLVLSLTRPVIMIFYLTIKFYHIQTYSIQSYGIPVINKSVRN
jgi:hypothetical protein